MIEQAPRDDSTNARTAEVDFGPELRRFRERRGITLRAIADSTKLPISALKALEENRISQLPGGIYRRAILRSYSAEVGLDGERVVQAFLERYPDDVPSPVAPPTAEPRGVPRVLRAVISLVSALAPVLAGVFYLASGTAGSDKPPLVPPEMLVRANDAAQSAGVSAAAASDLLPMMISVSSQTRLAVIADGREVVARQLEPGEIIRLSLADDVVLMGDNAGAVQFSINGRAGRTLGDEGVALSARIERSDYLSWLIQQ